MVEGNVKLNSVHKFNMLLIDKQTVLLPKGAKILRVDFQWDNPVMWALVDKGEKENEIRTFSIWGTGEVIVGDPGTFISTMFLVNSHEVYHVFEVTG